MDGERGADFRPDAVGRPRLVAARSLYRVAVHRVADPQGLAALALEGADERRQVGFDLVRAEAADQRQSPGLLRGIENVDQPDQVVRRSDGPHLRPMGLRMPRAYSTCAPCRWRVRSPIHSMCPEVA